MTNKQKRSGGTLAPSRDVCLMGACQRHGQRQQQRNVATWFERMQAAAAKQRALAK